MKGYRVKESIELDRKGAREMRERRSLSLTLEFSFWPSQMSISGEITLSLARNKMEKRAAEEARAHIINDADSCLSFSIYPSLTSSSFSP